MQILAYILFSAALLYVLVAFIFIVIDVIKYEAWWLLFASHAMIAICVGYLMLLK